MMASRCAGSRTRNSAMTVVVVANSQGGVGKSTLATHVTGYLVCQ